MEMNPNETPVVIAKAKRGPWKVLAIIFMVIATVSIVGCIAQDLNNAATEASYCAALNELQAENAALLEQVASLNATIKEKDDTIAQQDTTISGLEQEAIKQKKSYEDITSFLLRSDAGKVDYKFKMDTPIVVMKKGGTKFTATLTTGYNASYGYKTADESICYVDFANDSWRGSFVDITFTPKERGVTTVTFANTKIDKTFKVLVIVL